MSTVQSLLAWPHGVVGGAEWLREGARGRTLSPGQGSEKAEEVLTELSCQLRVG